MKDLWDVCKRCPRKCCPTAGPVILPQERDSIIQKTGEDCLIPQEGGKYFMVNFVPGKEACLYLLGSGRCLLHDLGVKPADCRAWPVGLTTDGDFMISTDCLAVAFLSKDYFLEAKRIPEEAFNTPSLRRIYFAINAKSFLCKRVRLAWPDEEGVYVVLDEIPI